MKVDCKARRVVMRCTWREFSLVKEAMVQWAEMLENHGDRSAAKALRSMTLNMPAATVREFKEDDAAIAQAAECLVDVQELDPDDEHSFVCAKCDGHALPRSPAFKLNGDGDVICEKCALEGTGGKCSVCELSEFPGGMLHSATGTPAIYVVKGKPACLPCWLDYAASPTDD